LLNLVINFVYLMPTLFSLPCLPAKWAVYPADVSSDSHKNDFNYL